jgi:hypothetical protein
MKVCTKCKIEKSFDNFSKDSNGKFGLKSSCKCCLKKYRIDNQDKIRKQQKEYRKITFNSKKKYYFDNKETIQKYQIEYRKKNKEKINEQIKNRRKNRFENDPLYKFTCNVRNLIKNSFKRGNNQFKKNAKSESILGCTILEFKEHIEKQFTDGMNWENRSKWHLDHIHPVSLATTEEDIIKLNHYTNFQPLWAEDNILKGNKIL